MREKNKYFKLGFAFFVVFLISNAPFLKLNMAGLDFIKGLGVGIAVGFMILGILLKQNKLEKFRTKKKIIINRMFKY